MVASQSAMFLIQDMYHIMPEFIARRLKTFGKTISTSTLAYQVVGLALSTIILTIPLSFLTVFVFTKNGRAVISQNGVLLQCPATGTLNDLCSPIIYSKTPYSAFLLFSSPGLPISNADTNLNPVSLSVRINAELPWVMVALSIASTLVTFMAWRKAVSDIPTTSVTQLSELNMTAVDGGRKDVESNEYYDDCGSQLASAFVLRLLKYILDREGSLVKSSGCCCLLYLAAKWIAEFLGSVEYVVHRRWSSGVQFCKIWGLSLLDSNRKGFCHLESSGRPLRRSAHVDQFPCAKGLFSFVICSIKTFTPALVHAWLPSCRHTLGH
jgi:hypothetical protein